MVRSMETSQAPCRDVQRLGRSALAWWVPPRPQVGFRRIPRSLRWRGEIGLRIAIRTVASPPTETARSRTTLLRHQPSRSQLVTGFGTVLPRTAKELARLLTS